jgi:hypothetical protein
MIEDVTERVLVPRLFPEADDTPDKPSLIPPPEDPLYRPEEIDTRPIRKI